MQIQHQTQWDKATQTLIIAFEHQTQHPPPPITQNAKNREWGEREHNYMHKTMLITFHYVN